MFNKSILKTLGFGIAIVILLTLTQCAKRVASDLPKDILGISVGMDKAEAQKRLEEIAQFESEDRETGQLWRLKNDPHFNNIAVAYDANNQIRFVTALVEKATAKERMRFSDVGDLSVARKEVVGAHNKYFWDVPASENKPDYRIFAYGNEPEFLTIYSHSNLSLSKNEKPSESKE